MFGKTDSLEILSRDLTRARDKRDALASHVTTLTAQIAELEASLSAENDRRERAANEVEGIRKHLRDVYLGLAPAIARFRDATERAAAIVPEAREFDDLLQVIATEVANATDGLLGDLDGRINASRADTATPELLQSADGSPELQQDTDRVLLRLPEWAAQRKVKSAADQCCTAAA